MLTSTLLGTPHAAIPACPSRPCSTASHIPGPSPPCLCPCQPVQLFVGGQWVDAASGRTFPVLDPRTAKEVFRVAEADKEDVEL